MTILERNQAFFDRHPGLLPGLPRAYKVSNPNLHYTFLGWFVADPQHMPIADTGNIVVLHEGKGGAR